MTQCNTIHYITIKYFLIINCNYNDRNNDNDTSNDKKLFLVGHFC